MKKNCWEFKGCGQRREGCGKGLVECPVPRMSSSNGINGGTNAGRICWIIANTMCTGGAETTFEEMIRICSGCDFYRLVKEEEGEKMLLPLDLIQQIYEKSKALKTEDMQKQG